MGDSAHTHTQLNCPFLLAMLFWTCAVFSAHTKRQACTHTCMIAGEASAEARVQGAGVRRDHLLR